MSNDLGAAIEAGERWWVIAETDLHAALRRVANGDDPDIAMAELVANSSTDDGSEE